MRRAELDGDAELSCAEYARRMVMQKLGAKRCTKLSPATSQPLGVIARGSSSVGELRHTSSHGTLRDLRTLMWRAEMHGDGELDYTECARRVGMHQLTTAFVAQPAAAATGSPRAVGRMHNVGQGAPCRHALPPAARGPGRQRRAGRRRARAPDAPAEVRRRTGL